MGVAMSKQDKKQKNIANNQSLKVVPAKNLKIVLIK